MVAKSGFFKGEKSIVYEKYISILSGHQQHLNNTTEVQKNTRQKKNIK